jgi:hypothetical protein
MTIFWIALGFFVVGYFIGYYIRDSIHREIILPKNEDSFIQIPTNKKWN